MVENTWNRLATRLTFGIHRKTTSHTPGSALKQHLLLSYHVAKPTKMTGPTSQDLIIWHQRPYRADPMRRVCFLEVSLLFETCPVNSNHFPPWQHETGSSFPWRFLVWWTYFLVGLLIDWLTSLRHISTERLIVLRNVDMIKIRR